MNENFERVKLLIEQQRYGLAEQELQEMLAIEPDHAIAHSMLGFCKGKQGQFAAALDSARTGVALAPKSAFAHYHLAQAYYWLNKYPAMYQSIQDMKAIAPDDPDAHMLEALYWAKKERLLSMLSSAEEGLRHDPRHLLCQIFRVQALIGLDRLPAAEEGIQKLLRQEPDHPQVHTARGWIELRKGRTKTAIKDFQEALRLEPDSDWANQGLMTSLRRQNPLNILHYINPYGHLLFNRQQVQDSYWLTAAPFIFLMGAGASLFTQNLLFLLWTGALFIVAYLTSRVILAESKAIRIRSGVAAVLLLAAAGACSVALLSQSDQFWMLSCGAGLLAYLLCRKWDQMGNFEQTVCFSIGASAGMGLICLLIAMGGESMEWLADMGETSVKLALAGFISLIIVHLNSFGS